MSKSIDIGIANEKLHVILNDCRDSLCEDAINEVLHYIEHGEPEIAFEGLFIELMQLGIMPKNIEEADCIELGRYLRLDRESVLDDEFWRKFISFLRGGIVKNC